MPTIIISYHQTAQPNPAARVLLGTETLVNVSEGLVPRCMTHPVFLVKRFANVPNTRWSVSRCVATSVNGAEPATFEVDLEKVIPPYPEEYLSETLRRMKHVRTAAQLLHQGTLVEVDFGFVQASAGHAAALGTNERYADTLQRGEMNKRRLAIVNKVYDSRVQVIPVSSQAPASRHDKSAFQLSDPSVAQLVFYGANGKESWVICSMAQTVAFTRVLPPASYFLEGRIRKNGRNPRYSVDITKEDLRQMRCALAHAVGFKDYDQMLLDSQDIQNVRQQLESAARRLVDQNAEIDQLRKVERVARQWAIDMGGVHLLSQAVAALDNQD